MPAVKPVLHTSSCTGQASQEESHVRRQTLQSSYDSTQVVLAMVVNMLNTMLCRLQITVNVIIINEEKFVTTTATTHFMAINLNTSLISL